MVRYIKGGAAVDANAAQEKIYGNFNAKQAIFFTHRYAQELCRVHSGVYFIGNILIRIGEVF